MNVDSHLTRRKYCKPNFIIGMQILLQGITPLALSLTPTITHSADTKYHTFSSPAISIQLRAKIEADYIYRMIHTTGHTLIAGETLDVIAKNYFVSPETLREINRVKFPNDNDYNGVSVGQFVMVPQWKSASEAASALAACYQQSNINSFLLTHKTITPVLSNQSTLESNKVPLTEQLGNQPKKEDEQVAQWLTQAGQIANSNHSTDAAKNLAIGSMNQVANSSVENWLNQFGHARIQMNVDEQMHLQGSSADLLLPLQNDNDLLTFTQLGIHDKDKYTTANFGLGQRLYSTKQMFGYNAFIDQELRNNHTRLGIGAEYWRDYVKIAGNAYLGLTGWKNSKTLQDYEEKPASGFDVRSEGYLPAMPQLGAKLNYEQYFGSNVGLFGKDQRQKDPFAVTAGLNYTPIPLVTAGVDYKQGKSGVNDTQFNLQFNYLFGVPWQDQISGEQVDILRTLDGSRLDFVNRNNNMVMQYKKMEVIKLSLPAKLSGEVSTQQTIIATVKASHGLSRIQWSDSSLLAAGGSIKQINNVQYQITLPTSVGSFPVSAIAYDTRGNASNAASTLITTSSTSTVKPTLTISTLSPNITSVPADGSTPVTYTLTAVTGARSTTINYQDYKIRWANSGAGDLQAKETALNADGQGNVTLTSMVGGNVNLTATLVDATGSQLDQKNDQSVEFTNNYSLEKIVSDKSTANADNTDTITLTTDATKNGVPLVASSVKWTMTFADNSVKSVTTQTDSTGKAVISLTSNVPGPVNITAELKDTAGIVVAKRTGKVDFNTTTPVIGSLTLVGAQSQNQWTDRSAELSVSIKDKNGAAVSGEKVSWDISNCQDCTAPTNSVADEQGELVAKLELSAKANEGNRTIKVCSTTDSSKCATTAISFLSPPEMKEYQTLGTSSAKSGNTFNDVRIKDGEIKITASGTSDKSVNYSWSSNVSQLTLSGTDALQRTITLTDNVGGSITVTAKIDGLEERTATFTVSNNTQWYYLPDGAVFYYPNINAPAAGCRTASAVGSDSEMSGIYSVWGNFFNYNTDLNRKDGFGNLPVWVSGSSDGSAAKLFYFAGNGKEGTFLDNISVASSQAWAVCK